MRKKSYPVHPGEVLLEEFLKPMGLSQNRLAVATLAPAVTQVQVSACRRAESTKSCSASVA
jgi:plasmid maintenance system antidote protein VapI